MKFAFSLILVTCFVILASAQEPTLTPLDFGFGMLEHGMVDFSNPPPQTKAGRFNSDNYLDIARFDGNRLEIYISTTFGYTTEPQQVKTFGKPIASLGFGGTVWDTHPPLKVTFTDGSQELFFLRRGMLDLGGDVLPSPSSRPPRTIDEIDIQIAWESEEYPEKMNKCTVGDVDGDGIMEFISTYKEWNYADTVHIVIYKNSGDDTYELFMDELFYDTIAAQSAGTSFMMITDMDQNGQNELMFTYDGCYFWEFSAPGVYTEYRSNFVFPRAVRDIKLSDFDKDSIPELSVVMCNSDFMPPTAYYVCEFEEKDTVNNMMNMDILTGFWRNWDENSLAVGDFDGDGTDNIVPGVFYIMYSWFIVDMPFYRYNPGSPTLFDFYWLETGLPIRCSTPIIEDFDNDGDLDLFAGGRTYGGGAAFVWEGAGLLSGCASWVDTVDSPSNIFFSNFGWVDGAPSIVSSYTPVVAPTTTSMLSLRQWQNDEFILAWVTPYLYSSDYRTPQLADMDGDGKMSILVAEDDHNRLIDWEQISLGVWDQPKDQVPTNFTLNPVFPNPFNPTTTITFTLPMAGEVDFSVFDISGSRVGVGLAPTRSYPPGTHSIQFDGSDLPSGIYFIRLESEANRQTVKAVLVK